MKNNMITLICVFLFISIKMQAQIMDKTTKEFSEGLQKESVQILDVRTPTEFAAGHLKNAINIDYWDTAFSEKIKGLEKNKPVYVYCKAGGRSTKAATILKDNGFKVIVNMTGGYDAWVASGLPVVQ